MIKIKSRLNLLLRFAILRGNRKIRGVQTMVDIKNRPDILDLINAILNNQGIVEIKNEVRRDGTDNLVVVEIKRQVRTRKPETR